MGITGSFDVNFLILDKLNSGDGIAFKLGEFFGIVNFFTGVLLDSGELFEFDELLDSGELFGFVKVLTGEFGELFGFVKVLTGELFEFGDSSGELFEFATFIIGELFDSVSFITGEFGDFVSFLLIHSLTL